MHTWLVCDKAAHNVIFWGVVFMLDVMPYKLVSVSKTDR
jgi:hypothetical protein